jgi:hypothetical protein
MQAAREGLERAQEHLDRAAERISHLDPNSPEQRRLREAREDDRRRDYLRDILELSRARHEASANARVIRTSAAASAEVINLGRRIDVRA